MKLTPRKIVIFVFGILFPIGMAIAIGILGFKTRNDPFPAKVEVKK